MRNHSILNLQNLNATLNINIHQSVKLGSAQLVLHYLNLI